MKRFFSLFITLFFVMACQSQVDVTQTIPANTATPEIPLTSTTQPTTPPQATPTQTLSVEFPDWVKNPDTQILLVPIIEIENNRSHYKGMYLFNAETAEKFSVPYTYQLGDYFWMPDGTGFGFVAKKSQEVILFSIKDEKVSKILMPVTAFRFINQYDSTPQQIQITSAKFNDPNFLFLLDWESLSPDKKYFIYYKGDYDGTYTTIVDISSGEEISISDPNDEYYDLYTEWSPSSSLLAIAEVDQPSSLFNSFDSFPSFRLRVYDVQTQQIVASYKNVTFPKWSPDGTKFLFQEWKGSEDFWYGGSPPCIFDTLSGKTNCFNELIINDKINITSAYWSPDQSMISFVYFNYAANTHSETGTFCTIELSTQNTSCLLAHLDTDEQNVIEYLWSPDSNFISFYYDTSYPISDYSDQPKLGIANIKTGNYFSIGLPSFGRESLGLWRPSPTQ